MLLPIILNSADASHKEIQLREILEINNESEKYGLVLNMQDAKAIVAARAAALQNSERIEMSNDVVKKITQMLYASPFICQEDYVFNINNIQEMFYYMKNETEDKIGDDELIDIIFNFYNNSCQGSIELLKETLQSFGENFRREKQKQDYNLERGIE